MPRKRKYTSRTWELIRELEAKCVAPGTWMAGKYDLIQDRYGNWSVTEFVNECHVTHAWLIDFVTALEYVATPVIEEKTCPEMLHN